MNVQQMWPIIKSSLLAGGLGGAFASAVLLSYAHTVVLCQLKLLLQILQLFDLVHDNRCLLCFAS